MCDDQQTTQAEEDEQLEKALLNVCTPYGDERKSELSASAFALMSHGEFLLTRAENSLGLTRKFLYIKSAVFLAASKYRFRLLSEATWCDRACEAVGNLHRSILCNLNCEEKSGMIMETTEAVKKRLFQLRKMQTAELNKIEVIQQNISQKEEVNLQKKKIETVKTLNEKATKDFSLLLYYIAKKCQSIIDDSPCKFCIVGLGSLAKQSVTLYSEVKYVIVLEEGVQYRETYQEILEYFRWFAVIFQVIIIGLEETPFRLIGVSSLNNFNDSYTPSGIALNKTVPLPYDQRVPSSKISQEFIKPVSEMLILWSLSKFSSSAQHLHKSLVRNFCFVYGSEELFDEFSESAYVHLFNEFDTSREQILCAAWSMNEILKVSPYLNSGDPTMIADSTFYRPISDSLFYIAKVFRWKCTSGFEIISSLKNFSSDLGSVCGRSGQCHYLELALAVACELRMKLYAIDNGSRHRRVNGSVFNLVEESCFRIALQQLWNLSRHLQDIQKYAESGKKPEFKSPRIPMNNGKNLEDVLNRQLNVLERNKNLSACDRKYILHNCLHTVDRLLRAYAETGKHDKALLERARRYLLRCPGYDANHTAMTSLIYVYIHQEKYSEIIELCEKHFKETRVGGENEKFQLRRYQIKALSLSLPPVEVIFYSVRALMKFKDPHAQVAFNFAKIIARNEDVHQRQDLTEFVELAVKENARFMEPTGLLHFLQDEVFVYQFEKKWFGDAIKTVDTSCLLLETKLRPINALAYSRLIGADAAHCYFEILPSISDSNKAVKMLLQVLNICVLANFRKDCHAYYIKALEYLHRKYKTTPTKFIRRAIDQYITLAPDELSSLPYLKILMASYYKAGNPSTTNMSGSARRILSPDEIRGKAAAPATDSEERDSSDESPTPSHNVEDEVGLRSNRAGDISNTEYSVNDTVNRLNRNGKDAVDTDFITCCDEVGPDPKRKSTSSCHHDVAEMKNNMESYKQADSLQSVSDKLEQTLKTKSHEICGTNSGNVCTDKMMNNDHAKLSINSMVSILQTPGNVSEVSDSTDENRLPLCDGKLKSNEDSKSPGTVTKIGSNSSFHERKNCSQPMVANGDQHVESKNSREVMSGMEIVENAPNSQAISIPPRSNDSLKKDLQEKLSDDLDTNSECDVSNSIIENGNHRREGHSKVCEETKPFRGTSVNDVGTQTDEGMREASYNHHSNPSDFPDSDAHGRSSDSQASGGSHSNIDDVELIAKMTSFNIDVQITHIGESTNVHLVVRERNPEVRANYDSVTSRSESDIGQR